MTDIFKGGWHRLLKSPATQCRHIAQKKTNKFDIYTKNKIWKINMFMSSLPIMPNFLRQFLLQKKSGRVDSLLKNIRNTNKIPFKY